MHPDAEAVYKYISKQSVISDLIGQKIIWVDDNNILLTKWAIESEPPLLFKVLPKEKGLLDQGNALVCWSIEKKGDAGANTWENTSLQKSWIQFDTSTSSRIALCYVSGNQETFGINHPAKLRHSGDKAKLISSNDTSGFTFRGRFTDCKLSMEQYGLQGCSIGSIASQKAHNALRWLIARQGFRNGDQVVVAWAISGKNVPKPSEPIEFDHDNLDDVTADNCQNDIESALDHSVDVGQSFSRNLQRYMQGYKANLQADETIAIIGLDSATPGRMAIIYYREYFAHKYIDVISKWYEDFAWFQRVSKEVVSEKEKTKKITSWQIFAPSIWDIVNTVYGDIVKSNDSLKKNIAERILPCIVEERDFPIDIITAAMKRASNPLSGEYWEWEKSIGVACALYRGYSKRTFHQSKQRSYSMALDNECTSKDYLYGRLLAVAESIEGYSLFLSGEKRLPNAIRLMQRFADRPFSTWRTIELSLQPYVQRLQSTRAGFVSKRLDLIGGIMDLFQNEDFKQDKALSGEFLLGFHSQRMELKKTSKDDEIETENQEGEK